MNIGLFLCIVAIILFLGGTGIAAFLRNKILDFNFTDIKDNAAKCATKILEKYGITKSEGASEETENNEDTECADVEEDNEIQQENQEETIGRVYEKIDDISGNKINKTRKIQYEKLHEDEIQNNELIDEENKKYPYVEITKGKRKYKTNKRDLEVCLSEDIYYSHSLSSACIASYEATKLSEGIDKPMKYKILSLFTIIPRVICQFCWILIVFCLFGMLYMSTTYVCVLGCISLMSYILSCLEVMYCRYISQKTLDNLIELDIIEDTEAESSRKILNVIAFIDMTHFSHSFRWFVNKILGYRW